MQKQIYLKITSFTGVKKMLNLFRKKTKYYSWSAYKEKVDFLDLLVWQQRVRKQSIKNIC